MNNLRNSKQKENIKEIRSRRDKDKDKEKSRQSKKINV